MIADVVIDTDVASRLMRNDVSKEMAELLGPATLVTTFVTVGELRRGAAHARWGARRIAGLERFLDELPVIPADHAVARVWGAITGRALRDGPPLPANDAWIAACCLTHDVPLATYNVRDFATVPGLRLLMS